MKITVFIKKPDLTFIVLELEALYTGGQSKRIHTYVLASKHAHTHTPTYPTSPFPHLSLTHTLRFYQRPNKPRCVLFGERAIALMKLGDV